jgi:hypothetical protein
VEMEARAAESSVTADKHFEDFYAKLSSDLAPLRKAYEHDIQSLSGICSSVPDIDPSVEDYICWLTSEVDYLPEVFMSVNENFISVAIKGMLPMAWGGGGLVLLIGSR